MYHYQRGGRWCFIPNQFFYSAHTKSAGGKRLFWKDRGPVPLIWKCFEQTKARKKLVHIKTNQYLENIDHNYKASEKKAKSKGLKQVFNLDINKARKI